ncbi:MAG TPA: DUF6527 family protein [Phenylobacterium sp.]|jgi:hypothetical protein|nr:DUF6527 family protein [Phenylobacterium sp.]
MTRPARTLRLCGQAEYRDQAEPHLHQPGDAALIFRGQARSLLIQCPDGCGQTLVINLDPRAGKAWRLDMRGGTPTLYPSVWRDGGCGSHFIVWRGRILWCDRYEVGNVEPDYDAGLEARVLKALTPQIFRSAEEIAWELDEIPWEVSRVARRLVRQALAEEGRGAKLNWFRDARALSSKADLSKAR